MGLLFLWLICAVIGALIGSSKRRALAGFLYSLILGPLGWLVIAQADGSGKQCPFCKSWIDKQAPVCPKCRRFRPIRSQEQIEEPLPRVVAGGHPRPRDKNRSIQWARDVMSSPNTWVIVDTETTGLGQTAEIIQVGVLAPDGSVLLDSYVRPLNRKRIPPDATAVNGITMKMLAGAPSYPDLAPALAKVLDGRWVISYNAAYDERLFLQTAKRNGGPVLSLSWNCAMIQYARFVGKWMESKHDYKWQKLPCAEHGAIADCRATLGLLKMMASTPLSTT